MARLREITLEQQSIIAECRTRQALRRLESRGDPCKRVHYVHALAAPARTRLDDEWKADARRLIEKAFRVLVAAVIAGCYGHAHCRHRGLRCAFRCHRSHSRGGRADENQTCGNAGLGKLGIF